MVAQSSNDFTKASSPIRDLRWRPPRPAPAWQGVLPTDAFKPMRMTTAPAIPGGPIEKVSEDCLYQNICASKETQR